MRNKTIIYLLTGILLVLTTACSVKWDKAISYGSLASTNINENVEIEIQNKLIIVPVRLEGKTYRFLFDTGAPFSISQQIQDDLECKLISKGNIKDSDHNRKAVNWVQVDSISIGGATFLNQTAFVGDFQANPLLACMEIDGIVGSNLMRHCKWTIDQEKNMLSLFSSIDATDDTDSISIPFRSDAQYNIYIDVNIGQAKVKNILVDYGSNGSVALSNEIFSTLKERKIISDPFIEKGSKQSGIIGEAVDLYREITYSDSVRFHQQGLNDVMIRTGKTVSLGNGLLSRFRISIDWENQKLHLLKLENTERKDAFLGFRLGYSEEKGIYVQSVIEGSNAYKSGIRPNMKVLKIDQLNFEKGDDFCDYFRHKSGRDIYMQTINSEGERMDYRFAKTPLKD
ncbi:aspartyl protease family protein [Marinifilum caeruleilacunae]|uniref:PDZ domain-containing protein n=1 Tax=Marinifilum caeruleilacunae TaxID=2499076 RepID=A0ABX1X1Y5_9BACT|nr:aspartyl protease family protein [Marinifilum caeruleilacunae]NOU62241.1 hypothetical protein [Marinifilum caeruleilacunae]